MKTTHFFAAAFVALSSLPVLAIRAGAFTQQDASAQAAGSASGSASVVEMRPVKGELVNKLDAKSAKAGDQVVVRTTESVKTGNGIEIPKGSRLVGTVTEVQAYGSDSPNSHVGIRFDRVELKGGQSLTIHSEIRSLSLPVSAAAMDSMGGDASLSSLGGGNSMGCGRGSMAGGGPAGGGLGGVGGTAGAAGSTPGGVANTTGRTPGTMNSAADDTVQSTGRLAGSATDAGGKAHASGIPGIMLAGRDSGASSASGTLWASKKNVHLDGGTLIVLAVAADQP